MIERGRPTTWQGLQEQTARILRQCGFVTQLEKEIVTARGKVEVDVYAEDTTQSPSATYLCECKHWKRTVPKAVVHAFRTVVSDFGANHGFLITREGFQSGASDAAAYTNVRLLTWEAFQEVFVDRWYREYFVPILREESEPLVDYTEPINGRIFRKADALIKASQNRFRKLRKEYQGLAFLALPLYLRLPMQASLHPNQSPRIALPLRTSLPVRLTTAAVDLPEDLLDITNYREFLETLCGHIRTGLAAFDGVFGERA